MKAKNFFQSFVHAFNGIATVFREEFNARFHFFAALMVIVLGVALQVSWFEWVVLILAMAGVITMEMFNTSIEYLADLYSTDPNQKIKKIKDLSAGAVLVMAIASLIIGIIIFLPKLLTKFNIMPV